MPVTETAPRLVLLFCGHMIDSPGRSDPRFSADFEGSAARRVGEELARQGAGQHDLAVCGGAGGGDLLFAEACVERGVPLEIWIPFEEEAFLAVSVDPSGAGWRERFHRVTAHPGVSVCSAMEPADGPLRSDAFERNNDRMLERSLAWGAGRLRFLALWDGLRGDGAGGTAAMVAAARRWTEAIRIIDPRALTAS